MGLILGTSAETRPSLQTGNVQRKNLIIFAVSSTELIYLHKFLCVHSLSHKWEEHFYEALNHFGFVTL